MSRLYSLKEIREIFDAEGFHIPDGTLRNYRDTFAEFLLFEGKGRFARYHEDSLEIFRKIRSYRTEHCLDNDEIKRRLTEEMPPEKREQLERFLKTKNAGGGMAPGAGAETEEPAGGPISDMIEDIDIRTRILLENNTKISALLQEKFSNDQGLPQLLKREIGLVVERLFTEQALLRKEIEDLKIRLERPSTEGSKRDFLEQKRGVLAEDFSTKNMPDEPPLTRKQRSFFDKLMKF